MSERGDYDRLASGYDSIKSPVGSDVMSAMMQFYCKRPLKDLRVLDAGCGTGNYAKDFKEYGVGHVTLLDASRGMLDQAKLKLSDAIAEGSIDIVEAMLPTLPFPDESFDVVMFNMVFNHLDKEEERDFPTGIQTLKEARRVLCPGGVIVISTVLPTTFMDSIWFTQLSKSLTEKFAKTLPSMEQLKKMFEAAGIKCLQKMNILGSGMLKNYYNLEGPLDEAWRKNYLYWLSATEKQLEEVKEKIEELNSKGELENWVKEHDHTGTAGHLTVFVCQPNTK